jgi:hypothetical protein
LGAGYRGLSFWSDRFLADSHQGRDRLLGLALLNQELDMLEPMLTTIEDAPQWLETSVPDIKAAVIRTGRGILVLPIWMGKYSQFVPGQAGAAKVTIKIPEVPRTTQAWEITPAEVRSLRFNRTVGGTEITLTDFGLTAAVVFTSDTRLVIRFQEQVKGRRQLAAQYSYDMALYEMGKILKTQQSLKKLGRTVPDAGPLVQDAQTRLKAARQYWDAHLFAEAYRESLRAQRPLRILMRAQWEQAIKGLDSPVSSPYAVSFFTLPKHWQFMEQISQATILNNVLTNGDFESNPTQGPNPWRMDDSTLDDVELSAMVVGDVQQPLNGRPGEIPTIRDQPHEGKNCLMLQIRPRGREPAPSALERTLLSVTSPSAALAPGSLVQVSGWVRIPTPITATTDGALIYDNAGGEPLAVRLTEPTLWKKFTFYRRVPATGSINVTLALTGIGTVYFDDIRIEPLGKRNAPQR